MFAFFFSERKEIPRLWTISMKIFKILEKYHGSCIFSIV